MEHTDSPNNRGRFSPGPVPGETAGARFDGEPQPNRRDRRLAYAVPAVLLLVLLAVIYANSLHGPFQFDDRINIVDNPNLNAQRLSWADLARAVRGKNTRTEAGLQRPVSFLTLALNQGLHGLEPFGYHLFNLSIHCLCTLLLFFLTIRILRLSAFGRNQSRAAVVGTALLSACLWGSHPIQVTAVTYIVQRMTALAGLFSLLAMYSYIEARTKPGGRFRAGYYAACLMFGLLAVGSKENAAMFPVNLALVEICLLSGSQVRSSARALSILGGAVLLVAVAGFWITDFSTILAAYEPRPFSLTQRLLTEPRVFFHYIGLLLYPVSGQFTLLHDIVLSTGFLTPWTTAPAAVLAIALPIGAFFLRSRLPLLSFSVLFFWTNHLIEGTIVPLEIVFEHRNYLPSMFFFLPPAAGFVWLLERYPARHPLKISAAALAVVYLFAQGHTVRMRNDLFSHPLLLWADNVKKAPGLHRPHHNLSNAFFAAGLSDRALEAAEKALEARPAARKSQKYLTWYNLGTYYLYIGRIPSAARCFEAALALQPKDPKIYHKLAVVNQIDGRLDAAEAYVREALRRGRGTPDFLPTLAMILLKKGEVDPAVQLAVSQLRRPGADDQWYYLLGEAFRHRQNLRRAVACFERYERQVPGQIAPTAARLELYDLLGMEAARENAARRLLCLSGAKDIAGVLEDYHSRYNTMTTARIERIHQAFERGLARMAAQPRTAEARQ